MPVIRTMYDLGPGGISTPDYDAQLALQRQIAGQNAQAQAFNQAMAISQGSFSQRQEMAKLAMQKQLYKAAQAAQEEQLTYDRGESEKKELDRQSTEQYRRKTLEETRFDRIARDEAIKTKTAADEAATKAEQKNWPAVSEEMAQNIPGLTIGAKISPKDFRMFQDSLIKEGRSKAEDLQSLSDRRAKRFLTLEKKFKYVVDKIKARKPLTDAQAKQFDKDIALWISRWKPHEKEATEQLKEYFQREFYGLPGPQEEVEGYVTPGTWWDQWMPGTGVPFSDEGAARHYGEQTEELQSLIEEAIKRYKGLPSAPQGPMPPDPYLQGAFPTPMPWERP